MVTELASTAVDAARRELYTAAAAHDPSKPIDHQLEAAARAFAKAQLDVAAGVTAAKHQAERDEKRGRQLCSSCVTDVVPAKDRDGRVTWLDAKTMQPALNFRHRRGHDLRRTFISLARSHGAQRDILRRATHKPPAEVIEGYTTFELEVVAAEVAKLRVQRRGANVVALPLPIAVGSRPGDPGADRSPAGECGAQTKTATMAGFAGEFVPGLSPEIASAHLNRVNSQGGTRIRTGGDGENGDGSTPSSAEIPHGSIRHVAEKSGSESITRGQGDKAVVAAVVALLERYRGSGDVEQLRRDLTALAARLNDGGSL